MLGHLDTYVEQTQFPLSLPLESFSRLSWKIDHYPLGIWLIQIHAIDQGAVIIYQVSGSGRFYFYKY